MSPLTISGAFRLKVEREHGDAAHVYVAERIGAAAMAGEQAGIDLWKAVAVRLDQLRAGEDAPS